eukprot:3123525-Prymnesium_polylepis.3
MREPSTCPPQFARTRCAKLEMIGTQPVSKLLGRGQEPRLQLDYAKELGGQQVVRVARGQVVERRAHIEHEVEAAP